MMLRNRLWISSVTVIAAMAAVLCHSQPAAAQFTGGCCFPGGECVEGPADLCPREQGGTPVAACLGDRNNDGADDACAPPPPTGACCSPDGQCTAVTAEECKLKNGSYQGDSTECVPGLCVPPEGACCFADGTCKIVGREECAANNGQYQGDGTQCDPSLCVPLIGACCDNLTGICADNVPESQCISVTGGPRFTWFGGLACDDPAVGCVAGRRLLHALRAVPTVNPGKLRQLRRSALPVCRVPRGRQREPDRRRMRNGFSAGELSPGHRHVRGPDRIRVCPAWRP